MATKRFACHTEAEILVKRANVVPKNTAKSNKKSANMLRAYLTEKEEDPQFENYSPSELNVVLSSFYLDTRTSDGHMYKTSSLENFRYGLNRHLKAPPHLKTFDIIKDTEFLSSNEIFKTVMSELKTLGKGDVQHYPAIEECDIHKLYSSIHMSTATPCGLLNKVQMDIRLYFCRRGLENIPEMTKDTFIVDVNPNTGVKFVKKSRDELVKNRRYNEKENFGGFMTENKDSPLCPVTSFEKLLSKLHPDNNRLWQRPKDTFSDNDSVWYTKQGLGRDSISSFMTKLSKACNLSKIYTNHSIRATGTTALFKNNFADSQIMAVTGHISVNSLAVYHRVSDQEKEEMGQAIQKLIQPSATMTTPQLQLPAPNAHKMLTAPKAHGMLTFPPIPKSKLFK